MKYLSVLKSAFKYRSGNLFCDVFYLDNTEVLSASQSGCVHIQCGVTLRQLL